MFGNRRVASELSQGSRQVTVDAMRPRGSLMATDNIPVNGGTFGPLTVSRLCLKAVFNEAVKELDASRISSANGEVANVAQVDSDTWRFELVGLNEGALLVSLRDGAVKDLAGNPSVTTSVWTAVYDVTAPVISMTYRPGPHWAFVMEAYDEVSQVRSVHCRRPPA